MNIYLIGYRCTGKTSVAKHLAQKLDMEFTDTDLLLEQEAGMHISNYVSYFGWESFRDLEEKIIRDISDRDRIAAATGGGAVLRENNVLCMKETGFVVWLTAGAGTILSRMRADENTAGRRPPLSQDPLEEEVRNTLKQRTPLYESACHMQVPTDNTDVKQICETIIRSSHVSKHLRNSVPGHNLG
ncbi:MAG: shikimate kinase [Desulfobacteraceae bacterium]|nr:shikimate kinase [Desulfobacteraceae bacterium]